MLPCDDRLHLHNFFNPQFKYIISHIYIHPFITHRLITNTIWPAPSWLVGWVGRAMHQYHRCLGFDSYTSLDFFRGYFHWCLSRVQHQGFLLQPKTGPNIWLFGMLSSVVDMNWNNWSLMSTCVTSESRTLKCYRKPCITDMIMLLLSLLKSKDCSL